MSILRALVLVGVVTALCDAFAKYDWDEGPTRALLVTLVLAVVAIAGQLGASKPWPRWLVGLAAIGVGALLFWHLKEGAYSTLRQRRSEMGDIHVRGVQLLLRGVTPWRFGTVLDLGSARALLEFPDVRACFGTEPTPTAAQVDALWASHEPGVGLFPSRIDAPSCGAAKHSLGLAGYKYGPVMMAAYVPLIGLYGRGGEFLTHLVFLLLILGGLLAASSSLRPEAVVLAALVVLGQQVLRRVTLLDSDCDLIPTALLVWALVGFQRGRPLMVGTLAALCLGAKVFPGAFVLPLVLLSGRRAWVSFVVASIVCWLPAFVLDGAGVWDNVIRFNLERPSDSTALVHFLSPSTTLLLRVGAAAAVGVALLGLARNRLDATTFVALSMGAFFLVSKVFHNNYIVWWLPVLGLALARRLVSSRATMEPVT